MLRTLNKQLNLNAVTAVNIIIFSNSNKTSTYLYIFEYKTAFFPGTMKQRCSPLENDLERTSKKKHWEEHLHIGKI